MVLVASQILGLLGIALGLLGYLPQILHLIRLQCSAGISMQAYFVWLGAAVLLLIHALMINDAVSILLQSLAATLDPGTLVLLGTGLPGMSRNVRRKRALSRLHGGPGSAHSLEDTSFPCEYVPRL